MLVPENALVFPEEAIPVPDSGTLCGLPTAPEVMTKLSDFAPMLVGVTSGHHTTCGICKEPPQVLLLIAYWVPVCSASEVRVTVDPVLLVIVTSAPNWWSGLSGYEGNTAGS